MIDGLSGQMAGSGLAEAIVNTVREPLLVLDSNLRVVVPSRSYCPGSSERSSKSKMTRRVSAETGRMPAPKRMQPIHSARSSVRIVIESSYNTC